jgi:hypothetical protein
MKEPVLTAPRLASVPWLSHGFGTRRFGLADLRSGAKRRKASVVILKQVHSAVVHVVDRVPAAILAGDALATATPGLVLVVKTADCLPLFLVDEKRRAVAAVHAGWRGTAQRIAERAVAALHERFGSEPEDLVAVLGPSIGALCYEVGEDVRRSFRESGLPGRSFVPLPVRPGKYLFDLAGANAGLLRAAGVRPGRIVRLDLCTHCEPGLHSFRRDRETRHRLYNFIAIMA